MFRRGFLKSATAGLLVVGLMGGFAPAHALEGDCSQPKSKGANPVASDCLFILKAAVGSATCDRPCICQVRGGSSVKASDALFCLKKSVGQSVALTCPCGTPDVQSDVNYKFAPSTDVKAEDATVQSNIRSKFVATNYLGAFSQDRVAALGDWTADWTVKIHGNNTVWHPASGGTLAGATPSADGNCPAGTTDIGNTNMPSPFSGSMDICQLPSRFSTDGGTLTLTNDNVYRTASSATGGTLIGDGDAANKVRNDALATGGKTKAVNSNLVIEPGTMVLGDIQEALIITRGSTIAVNGTKADPVVMNSITSWNSWVAGGTGVGSRREWGGLVLTGFAQVNYCNNNTTCDAVVEGVNAVVNYGAQGQYADDAWNAGSISYLVISHSGYDLGGGNDLNGLTMYALGYTTSISYVQTDLAGDDSFEFFGGTVVPNHLVAYGGLDDNLDSDVGFRGGAQFVLVVQKSDDCDKGIEADNNPAAAALDTFTPRSFPQYANLTVVNVTNGSSQTPVGFGLRTHGAINVWNSIQEFAERAGIRSEQSTATDNLTTHPLTGNGFHNVWMYNSGSTKGSFEGTNNTDAGDLATWFNSDPDNSTVTDPGIDELTGYPNQVTP